MSHSSHSSDTLLRNIYYFNLNVRLFSDCDSLTFTSSRSFQLLRSILIANIFQIIWNEEFVQFISNNYIHDKHSIT